jgi:serine/threonine-protein kinase RsbW
MMVEIPNVRLTLSNRPESVLIVRQMLTGLAELIGLTIPVLNGLVTAATEACNNVVIHAYDEQQGPLEVEVCVGRGMVGVTVRDRGVGMQQQARRGDSPSQGIGLHLIETLAAQTELVDCGGVEVRMTFATPQAERIDAPSDAPSGILREIARSELGGTVALEAAPAGLALGLLPRVLGSLAAQARFSVQALSDLRQLTDDLFAAAAESASEPFFGAATTISQEARELLMRLGPLQVGAADAVLTRLRRRETPSLLLAPAQTMLAAGSSELLMARLAESSATPTASGPG